MDQIVFGLAALLAIGAGCSGLPLYPRGYENRSVVARAALQTPDGKVAHHVIERGPARIDPKTHRIEQTSIVGLRLESAPPAAYKNDWDAPVQLRAASSLFESVLLRIVPCRAAPR